MRTYGSIWNIQWLLLIAPTVFFSIGGISGKVELGGACKEAEECKGVALGLGEKGVWCCDGTCTQMKKDWFGTHYCPKECRGGAFDGPGTCK